MSKTNFEELLEEELEDPEIRDAYDALGPEYEARAVIIEARATQGLTQKELARRAGIKASNLSRIENGKTSPTVSMLTRLARGMGKRLEIRIV